MEHIRSMSVTTIASTIAEQEDQRPVRCAKFRRQEMWAIKPVWSPMVVAIMYLIMAVILLPIGVVVFSGSAKLMRTKYLRYDDNERCSAEALLNGTKVSQPCRIIVEIPRNTSGNVFMYYGISNFYQNARRYATSRSIDQLRGLGANKSTGECKPAAVNNTVTAPLPCGLTAASRFNDSFLLCSDADRCSETQVNVTKKNIAWEVDRTQLFKPGKDYPREMTEYLEDQDFMVWMRLAPFRTWFKLSRRIMEPLENKTYFLEIQSNFPVASFQGQKFIYIAETSWFGGPNKFLGLASIAVGGLSLIFAIVYGVGSRVAPEPPMPPETKIEFWADEPTEPSKDR